MKAQAARISLFIGLPLLVAVTALGFVRRGDGTHLRIVQAAGAGAPALDPIHDPCIAKSGDFYYVYSTGRGVPIHRSRDLVHWEAIGRVFADDVPGWAKQAVPKSGNIWAPDISYFSGRFHLYYAVSSFGSNHSVIGLATNTTLDPTDKNYHWADQGKVFESLPADGYNAIDPNVAFTGPDRVALAFGSFWSGVKLVPLDSATGRPIPGAPITPLAQRPSPDALEAPFIVHHRDFFYLFVSFDFCCRGMDSTYNIRVGRAKQVTGPYADRDGVPLLSGGGTLVLGTQGDVIGPGGCAVLQGPKGDLLVHHYYDGTRNGFPTLQIRPLTWTADGWPVAGAPLAAASASGKQP